MVRRKALDISADGPVACRALQRVERMGGTSRSARCHLILRRRG
jgi:hypothetical protein